MCIDTLFFVHKHLVQGIDVLVHPFNVLEVVFETSRSAKGLEELDWNSVLRNGIEEHIDVASWACDVSVVGVGRIDDLVHGIL